MTSKPEHEGDSPGDGNAFLRSVDCGNNLIRPGDIEMIYDPAKNISRNYFIG